MIEKKNRVKKYFIIIISCLEYLDGRYLYI